MLNYLTYYEQAFHGSGYGHIIWLWSGMNPTSGKERTILTLARDYCVDNTPNIFVSWITESFADFRTRCIVLGHDLDPVL